MEVVEPSESKLELPVTDVLQIDDKDVLNLESENESEVSEITSMIDKESKIILEKRKSS